MVWDWVGGLGVGVLVGGLLVYRLIAFPLQDKLLRMRRLGFTAGDIDQRVERDPSESIRER